MMVLSAGVIPRYGFAQPRVSRGRALLAECPRVILMRLVLALIMSEEVAMIAADSGPMCE
jgi:hypothetical protein